MRLGVLGGSFDPPHYGHLSAAQEVCVVLGLDRVLFVPANVPPHKQGEPVSDVAHRLRMVELAIAGNPRFAVSRLEVERGGVSYTVDTLRALRAEFGPGQELFLIVGMDSLAQLPAWHEPQQLLELSVVVAVSRPGYPVVDMARMETMLPGITGRTVVVQVPGVDVASSDIQERVATGSPIKYLVPDSVEEYIYRHDLYPKPAPVPRS